MTTNQMMGMYNAVRKSLLTVWTTGELVKHPWFLQGLSSREKEQMMNICIEQVFLLRAHYNEGDFVHLTIKRAVAKVKHIIYYSAKKKLEADIHANTQTKFDMIEHLFRVQLGEEEAWWTYKLIKVSDCVVYNYEGEEDLFSKFVKRADGWYTYGWTTKFKYVDPERSRYLKSGKKERFNILENRMGSAENEYLQDCMLWEHLVDCYKAFKQPYGMVIMALNRDKCAPYSRTKAFELMKEFFYKAFVLYGINFKKDVNIRDMSTLMEIYGTLDMLLKERKRGYSVADVLSKK